MSSRGDREVSMSSMLLAMFLGRASALLKALFTGFRVSSAFPPVGFVLQSKEQIRWLRIKSLGQ